MGSFLTTLQVRSESTASVREALLPLVKGRAYISPPKNGWVTVYDEASDSQHDALLSRIAAVLSRSLHTAVFAFLVHDSDVAMYWLYQNGKLADKFHSAPEYFGDKVTDTARVRMRGNPDALLPHCVPGTRRAEVDAVLHPPDEAPVM